MSLIYILFVCPRSITFTFQSFGGGIVSPLLSRVPAVVYLSRRRYSITLLSKVSPGGGIVFRRRYTVLPLLSKVPAVVFSLLTVILFNPGDGQNIYPRMLSPATEERFSSGCGLWITSFEKLCSQATDTQTATWLMTLTSYSIETVILVGERSEDTPPPPRPPPAPFSPPPQPFSFRREYAVPLREITRR